MLNGLTGEPEVLDSIAMAAPASFEFGRQRSKNISRVAVNDQQGFSLYALQGS